VFFLSDFLLALVVAVALSVIFVAALGWRRGADESAAGGAALFFFVILFMATWAGGLWFAPVGVGYGLSYWFGFLAVGLLFALVLAAVPTGEERWRRRGRGGAPVTGATAAAVERRQHAADMDAAGLGAFFWVLVLLTLGFLVVLAYAL
jgi:hypothetical protein